MYPQHYTGTSEARSINQFEWDVGNVRIHITGEPDFEKANADCESNEEVQSLEDFMEEFW